MRRIDRPTGWCACHGDRSPALAASPLPTAVPRGRAFRTGLLAAIGLSLGLGCGTAPPAGRPAAPTASIVEGPEKVLAIAFDDLSTRLAASPPLGLTASDGTGLAIASLRARAVIDDPLAFTELTIAFDNPSDRVLEGTFSITLPKGAAISRFAMKHDAGWQEGEVVEKKQARAAYEDFLHRRQDPARLEQAAGNEFTARVFPIPARGRKELVVSYSHELTRRRPYAIPLAGLPPIGRLDVEAYVAGKAAPVLAISKQGVAPDGDFRVDPRLLGDRAGVRSGNLVLARVTPVAASQPDPLGATVFLIDTSASRALGLAEATRVLRRLAADVARAAGPRTPILVAAYDQAVEPVFDGAAGDLGEAVGERLRQRLALGASDLSGAIAWAGARARDRGIGRVVLITDGVATAGETAGDKLRAIVKGLGAAGVGRIDAVALGGIRDDALLESLVNAGLPRGGVVVDAAASGDEDTWRRLNETTRSGLEVHVEGASFTFPQRVDGVQAGDEVLVYANVPEELPVRLSIGGGPLVTPSLARVERPLLERAWAGAKLAALAERERVEGPSEALWAEVVGVSTRYRVLSPQTSLLVLESEDDYARFGIDRRALGDILVADGGRVGVAQRPAFAPKPPPVEVAVAAPARKPVADKWKDSPKGRPAAPPAASVATERAPAAKPSRAAGGKQASRRDDDLANAFAGAAAPAEAPAPAKVDAAPRERAKEAKSGESAAASRRGPAAPASPPSQPEAQRSPAPSPPPPPPEPSAAVAAAPVLDRPAPRPAATATASGPADRSPPSAAEDEHDRPSANRRRPEPRRAPDVAVAGDGEAFAHLPDLPKSDPYDGPFKDVMALLARGAVDEALRAAFAWRKKDPGDVMALVALGEAFEAAGMPRQAARCYGSIIDLFPARADLRRFAGERLERLADVAPVALALDTYLKAAAERPDHPAGHHLAAFAYLKLNRPDRAFDVIVRGLHQPYPSGRFAGVDRILREDLGLVGAAWAAEDPKRATEIRARTLQEGGAIEDEPSLRFVLNWETDANDVDFHIYDGRGGHAYYGSKELPSGGSLYADVTTGYGPECFTIRGARLAYPYRLQAHYFSRGPMGYGMGKLQIVEHDGAGKLTFTERPFVVMHDRAFVDLGDVTGRGAKVAGPAR